MQEPIKGKIHVDFDEENNVFHLMVCGSTPTIALLLRLVANETAHSAAKQDGDLERNRQKLVSTFVSALYDDDLQNVAKTTIDMSHLKEGTDHD